MKKIEARILLQELNALVNFLHSKKYESFTFYYGVNRTIDKLEAEEKIIQKSVPERLKELENKIHEGIKEHETFEKALKALPEDEQTEYTTSRDEFIKALEEECDVQIYKLNPDKFPDPPLDYAHSMILKKLLE